MELENAVIKLLKETANYRNFILSSGCDVPPHTSHVNIEAFYGALDKYNRTVIQ